MDTKKLFDVIGDAGGKITFNTWGFSGDGWYDVSGKELARFVRENQDELTSEKMVGLFFYEERVGAFLKVYSSPQNLWDYSQKSIGCFIADREEYKYIYPPWKPDKVLEQFNDYEKALISDSFLDIANASYENVRRVLDSLASKEKKKKKKPTRGHVYFVQDDQGRVKIGKAKKLKERLGEYTKLPSEPTLIATYEVSDYTLAEELLHEFFEDKRLRGEWFDLDADDIAAIQDKRLPDEIISLVA